MEEMIDVLDQNGNKTGEVKPKSQIKRDGNFHGAISVCIVNTQGEILMTRRSSEKKVFPNLRSRFIRGHISSGETPLEACLREIKEEIGIKIQESDLEFLYTMKEEDTSKEEYINNLFYYEYLLQKDIKLNQIKTEVSEISEVKYMSYIEAKKLLQENPERFVPNEKDYKRILKRLHNHAK